MTSSAFTIDDILITRVSNHVKDYMAHYDASHDFHHIQRVVRLAQHIQSHTPNTSPEVVTLCALLHDVGDRKYVKAEEDASRLIYTFLVSIDVPAELAEKIQTICLGVSYSSETKDPGKVLALIKEYPELAVVQDADRLDAIGAVGIGRAFTFGGAKNRSLGSSMDHFEEKLLKIEGMMKTDVGRELAKERTRRMRLMKQWWESETGGTVQ